MGGAAVALLAATRRHHRPLASLLSRAERGLHDASVAAAEVEDKAGMRSRRRRSSSSRLLGPDFPETWGQPPRAATRTPSQRGAGANYDRTATIIDGKSIAEDIRLHIAEEVRQMKSAVGHVPGLAVVLVGDRRDSESYVRYKTKGCEEVGIKSLLAKLPGNCTEDEVMDSVTRFNEDPSVHGILVQLPLPQRMDEERILSAISLEKDVDGFHPLNVGNLALRSRKPLFVPCAAKACVELLLQSGIELMGKHVTVIGRSKVVGLPTSLLLQRHHATVSVIHAFTTNPETITRESDIVISAAGVANLVRGSWLKQGAIVIDVGTNPIEDSTSDYGYRLTGDVCFEEAVKVASAITPVPGGVGPVTIAMLLANTLDSAKRVYGLSD
ncbi:bifunctional protein FolD 1, mitochondrial-like [Phragmites australis]|uniref:bifunctional protein FolD 1, mitochondrial-like n=1 Tax=Phragmites australis TaxID=29695 RepID=UPI002D76C383|nr:bifunctional protein FolD 1, mitochondrial-like [Phragmites australis]